LPLEAKGDYSDIVVFITFGGVLMSTAANIAIQDGQGTPVTHTFYPIQTTDPVIYRESLASTPTIGNGTINVAVRENASGLVKVTVTMRLPALETASGANPEGYTAAPKEAYTNQAKLELVLPVRGTVDQRKDLRVLFADLLGDAQIVDLIDELRKPY